MRDFKSASICLTLNHGKLSVVVCVYGMCMLSLVVVTQNSLLYSLPPVFGVTTKYFYYYYYLLLGLLVVSFGFRFQKRLLLPADKCVTFSVSDSRDVSATFCSCVCLDASSLALVSDLMGQSIFRKHSIINV